MKSHSPALTPAALASVARSKTTKVQKKLQQAEAELHTANEVLVKAVPKRDVKVINLAVVRNIAAEEKVHEATEELEEVKELLGDAQAREGGEPKVAGRAKRGKTGEGAKSLIPLLKTASG